MTRRLHFWILLITGLSILAWTCTPKTGNNLAKTEEITSDAAPILDQPPAGATSQGLPIDPQVRIGKLENGLTYYIRANEKPDNIAALRLAVKVGSINEDNDQQGLAHFVEHMAFNGTEHFAKSELIDYLQSIGTRFGPDLNAYTSFDETVYMLQVRTDSMEVLSKGLLILEDWAQAVSFEEEEIDKERGIVVSELRSGLGADQRMRNEYLPVVFYGSKYADRLPIGKREILENAPYEALKRYYRDWYRPDLMAVMAVGDFDPDEIEKEIKSRFGKIPAEQNPRPRETYEFPNHQETMVSIVQDKEARFSTARLLFKHKHQTILTQEDYRKSIIRNLYNQMLNNRLNELRQSAEPPFLYGYSGYGREVGNLDTYTSFTSTAEGKVLEGLKSVLLENLRVLRHGFTASELERAKLERLSRAEANAKEEGKIESDRIVSQCLQHFLNQSPILSPTQQLQLIKEIFPSISLDEVNQLAKKWITDDNRVVVITSPEKEDVPLPTEEKVLALIEEVENSKIEAYEDEVSDEPLLAKELSPLPLASSNEITELGITEWTLSNGVRVILKPTEFQNDEVLFTAFSPGGYSLYPKEDYLSAYFGFFIINESGVGALDKVALQKKLTGKQVNISSSIDELDEGMQGSSTVADLETMFQLTYLYFTAPRKDENVFTSNMTRQKQALQNLMIDPNYYFSDQISRIKYNDDPRRRIPTVKELEQVSLEKIYEIYQDRFEDASDFTFVFVGNFSLERIKPHVLKYLGNLPTTDRQENWKNLDIKLAKGEVKSRFHYGQAPKAQIEITFHGEFDWDIRENRHHFNSLVEVLRNRMRESMREDKGGVYGVGVRGNLSKYPDETYRITISFNAEPDQVDELIQTAMQDIKNARATGASQEDLQKIKAIQRQSRIKNLEKNQFWLNTLRSHYYYGIDPHFITLEKYGELIDGLTSDDIKQMANHCFGNDNYIEIVMTPQSEAKR